jgi:phosphoserine phosphatase
LVVLADILGIDAERVHGVTLRFDDRGQYAGYDSTSPLAGANGKAIVCRRLMAPHERAALVGDGMTDLEVEAEGVAFIGYGGIVTRANVRRRARLYEDGKRLTVLLPHLLTPQEQHCFSARTRPG